MKALKNIAAPDCVMSANADSTGKVISASVCAWCQKENNESGRLGLWLASVGLTQANATHGICLHHQTAWMNEVDENKKLPIDDREKPGRS